MAKEKTVAIVGRMNVGKSTLFNRLTESQRAITSSWAGTTRDATRAPVIWRGTQFDIMDTGGLDVIDDEQLEERVIAVADKAILESDMILFVVDGPAGLLPQDRELAKRFRKSKTPVILVVNKSDTTSKEQRAQAEFLQMGIEPMICVSAGNGRGTGDLLDIIYERLEATTDAAEVDTRTKVAIVGQPNVGKSSLLNAILGEERVIVADQAHTTRDTNDIPYSYKGREFLLVDTAGIRRKSNVGKRWADKRLGGIEKASVSQAIEAMLRADVVLFVIEAQKRVTAQDKKIADLANDYGKGMILVFNKWDLIEEKTPTTINEFSGYFDQALPYLRWAPMIFTSATGKLRVRETLDMVAQVSENYERQIDPDILYAILGIIRAGYNPRQGGTRKYKKTIVDFKGLEQVGSRPPHFYLRCSKPKDVPSAIPKIIERELRARAEFDGVKIIIEIGT
ncbi:MAG: ribosome biogenesis GTPase Der [Candidatus Kerfeldbacteria bacterium CG15_BIG_FIL_POST_REV_8_21_14_020_45_12]|uniref:GTPase Der n=1 Tax=Candidatus Kerfeldbacteria bacterium CG15_BIG_FIL_POST_REV_8_21_14_020_45_12 TaxID=2014247 RepID=A0A2M7H263_9BACT|nr:MAG: ribosome biogenesis GTPase Der [Candidatus Kerfeldbacteria bacterium CG15_BIG_FIL_POST_REV_8_21_14_020_45_12]PJA93433.1 MAG: ribosome biogenesis GTPase Der [Candidatus Kerfeldbacteria bacterium CG_4_9_14_3_um_filter_45_8]